MYTHQGDGGIISASDAHGRQHYVLLCILTDANKENVLNNCIIFRCHTLLPIRLMLQAEKTSSIKKLAGCSPLANVIHILAVSRNVCCLLAVKLLDYFVSMVFVMIYLRFGTLILRNIVMTSKLYDFMWWSSM